MSNRTLTDWLTYIEGLHAVAIDLGLDRVAEVAGRLNVVEPAPRVLVVAGTNGKGSTAVFAEALLSHAGYRVGTTLSPHVHRFNERVRIDGRPVDDSTLCASFAAVEAARGAVPLTYFEFAILVALHRIRVERCDVAVLEVGLGGRLDAVNVVAGQVAVVTSIGLDHQSYLGDDVEQIGREKAGIFRADQQVVLGLPVTESVRYRARELGCSVTELGRNFTLTLDPDGWSVSEPPGLGRLPFGFLAPQNCAVALAAVSRLVGGEALTAEVVRGALAVARLPGRCERLPDPRTVVVVDVAHNPAGAEFLSAQLRHRYPGCRWTLILGMLADKDAEGVAMALDDVVQRWLCVSTSGARGQAATDLVERVRSGRPGREPTAWPDLATALAQARVCTPGAAPEAAPEAAHSGILICGSFAVVEAARDLVAGADAEPREPDPGRI